jgi:putative flavoprotein involved in K+ transport
LIGTDLGRVARENAVALVGRTVGAEDDRIITADGRSLEVASVVWATGFRPDYTWLQAPVFDETGKPVHKRGLTSVAGLYFLGLPWQHTRGSALLGGVGRDASYLAAVISETEQLNLVQSNAS